MGKCIEIIQDTYVVMELNRPEGFLQVLKSDPPSSTEYEYRDPTKLCLKRILEALKQFHRMRQLPEFSQCRLQQPSDHFIQFMATFPAFTAFLRTNRAIQHQTRLVRLHNLE